MNGFHSAYLVYGKCCEACINNTDLQNTGRKRLKCLGEGCPIAISRREAMKNAEKQEQQLGGV